MKLPLYCVLLGMAGLSAVQANDDAVVIETVKPEEATPAAEGEPDMSAWSGVAPDDQVKLLNAGGGKGDVEIPSSGGPDVPEVPTEEVPIEVIRDGGGEAIDPVIFQTGAVNPMPTEDPAPAPEPVAVPEREDAPKLEIPVKEEEPTIEPEVQKALEIGKSSRKVQGFSIKRKMKEAPGAKSALKRGKRVFLE